MVLMSCNLIISCVRTVGVFELFGKLPYSFVKLHPQRKQSKQINQTGILLPDSANRDESRKWHSCATQLIMVIDDWAKILDNQGQIETYILDFEKALDTPPHELLKSKLFSYGIGGKQ